MDFRFNEEQDELRAMARSFLEENSDSEAIRRAMDSELGWDPELWAQLAGELGWAAVHIPEAYGGLDLGHVELVALMEIMGEHLTCAPFLSSVVLSTHLLLESGDEEKKQAFLPALAEGEARASLAFAHRQGGAGPEDITATVERHGDDYRLEGEYGFVVDGHSADQLILAARSPGTQGLDGISLFLIPDDTPGIARRALPTMDQTRRLAEVDLPGVILPAQTLLGEWEASGPALWRSLQLSAIALAAEQVGGAQACLDMSVAYATEREQFGRPIGSFQAIKHKCADMMVLVESARSAVYYAACAANEGGEELSACAALAKAYCSDAYFQCAADAIQIHGGVGFTWEYDVHLHFKRARSSEHLLGAPPYHRERVAREIGL
ncbi:MAG: acyl-CoA dehydrogenase family protein [Myxococcota bacterium]|nr:acyl-CoA dehydrogenase family protein [Myxococcota bacterium]